MMALEAGHASPAFLLTGAGRAKTRNSACGFIKIRRFAQCCLHDRCDDQLRNPGSTLDHEGCLSQIDQNDLDLAAVIRIYGSGSVQDGDTVTHGQARTRPHLAFGAGRNERALAGLKRDGAISRERRQKIEAGGALALIGRQRQVGRMRQPLGPKHGPAHLAAPASAWAMRATSASATSSFDCGGQASTRSAVIKCTRLRSPPMTPLSGETSLARIQSQPLRLRLALALATTFSVSAAKPITNGGRLALRCATCARMSGFSTSFRLGGAPFDFLIFSRPGSAKRQSATAAANTAQSTGSACSTASSISRAVSTLTTLTPAGSES